MGRAAPLIVCERRGAGSIGGEGSAGAMPEGGIESPFGHRSPFFEPIEPVEPISFAIKGQNVSGARSAPSP